MSNYNSADPTMPKRTIPRRGTVILIPEDLAREGLIKKIKRLMEYKSKEKSFIITPKQLRKRAESRKSSERPFHFGTIHINAEEEMDFGTGGKLFLLRQGVNAKLPIGETKWSNLV